MGAAESTQAVQPGEADRILAASSSPPEAVAQNLAESKPDDMLAARQTNSKVTGCRLGQETVTVSSTAIPSSSDRHPLSEGHVPKYTDGGKWMQPLDPLSLSTFGSHAVTLKGEDGLRAERISIGGEQIMAALVCDGHGGHEAAALVIDQLIATFADAAHGDASAASLRVAAATAFAALHDKMLSEAKTTAGTTATLCVVNETRGELTCCSTGDSWAMMITRPKARNMSPELTQLTPNTRLNDSAEERKRVVAAGGQLGRATNADGHPSGPIRAWPGGVANARSIGDSDCGKWLIPTPICVTHTFPDAAAVVLATDGVWDALSPETVSKYALAAEDPVKAAERVVRRALKARGKRDDITCLVLVSGRSGGGPLMDAEFSASTEASGAATGTVASNSSSSSTSTTSTSSYREQHAPRTRSKLLSSLLPSRALAAASSGTTPKGAAAAAASAAVVKGDPSVKGGRLFEGFASGKLSPSTNSVFNLLPDQLSSAPSSPPRNRFSDSGVRNELFSLDGLPLDHSPLATPEGSLDGSIPLLDRLVLSPSGTPTTDPHHSAMPAATTLSVTL